MKLFLMFIFLFFVIFTISSQDFIILKNSDTIKCKILDDKISFLEYKLNLNDTTVYTIKADIFDFYIKNDNIDASANTSQIIKTEELKYKINCKTLKKGAYLNFDEFINNNPSIDFNFIVIKRSNFSIAMMGGNNYKVKVLDNSMDPSRVKRKFWGICDGKECYINCFPISKIKHYGQLLLEGIQAYFYAMPSNQERRNSTMAAGVMFGAVGGAVAGASAAFDRNLYRLDFKTGEIRKQ